MNHIDIYKRVCTYIDKHQDVMRSLIKLTRTLADDLEKYNDMLSVIPMLINAQVKNTKAANELREKLTGISGLSQELKDSLAAFGDIGSLSDDYTG